MAAEHDHWCCSTLKIPEARIPVSHMITVKTSTNSDGHMNLEGACHYGLWPAPLRGWTWLGRAVAWDPTWLAHACAGGTHIYTIIDRREGVVSRVGGKACKSVSSWAKVVVAKGEAGVFGTGVCRFRVCGGPPQDSKPTSRKGGHGAAASKPCRRQDRRHLGGRGGHGNKPSRAAPTRTKQSTSGT